MKRTPTEDEKKILNQLTPYSLYEALLKSLGIIDDSRDGYYLVEGNMIKKYYDVSTHGSPDYRVTAQTKIGQNQANALNLLYNSDTKRLMRKASIEVELKKIEYELRHIEVIKKHLDEEIERLSK